MRPLEVRVELPIKTYDIDFAGIVHNMVYIRWLEDMRLHILDRYCPLTTMLETGISPVLSGTDIAYHYPLRLQDQAVNGAMWVSKLGRARWVLSAEMRLGERQIATATQTGYFVDLAAFRPVRIPAALREQWEAAR